MPANRSDKAVKKKPDPGSDSERRKRSFDALLARLRRQPTKKVGRWRRDDLYKK